jgi:hypothetical protein
MQRLAAFALATLLTTGTLLGACVSNDNNPLAPGGSTGLDLDGGADSAPGTDAGPIADSSTVDSTLPPGTDAGDSGASGNDAGDSAASSDGAGPDASDGGIVDASLSYADVYAPSDWTVFDTNVLDAGVGTMNGATFDGRYAYFAPYGSAPNNDGIITRFDTTQGFSSPGAWATIDAKTTAGLSGSGRFGGAVFDGRYVYFGANSNNPTPSASVADQTFVRYDTTGDFETASSWVQFDGSGLPNLNPGGEEFLGGTFDGRYVYFASYFFTTVVIYDTQGAFGSSSSWSTFDTSTLNPAEPDFGNIVFSGTIFDGTYVYFLGEIVARYNTTMGIDAGASAWESFNAQGIPGASALAWAFGGYDGRYVYMVNAATDLVTRYDTQATFTSVSSWSTFDVSTAGGAAGGYNATDFDGRYLYFAPNSTTFAIYDTQAPFGSASSWTTFDTSALTGAPTSFQTMLFDGQYLYVAGHLSAASIVRIDLGTTAGPLPALPQFHGSFF